MAALLLAVFALGVSPLAADGDHGSRIFGPKEYVRTTGAPNTYTDTFTLPGWIVAPFTLHIQNGDDDGRERVSSATITINSTQVLGPSDFNPHVGSLDRQVTLGAQNTLKVTLASSPGSFLIVTLSGSSGDHQGPTVKIVAPADGSVIHTATPFMDVSYGDPDSERRAGKSDDGHGHGSGCDSSTLKITLDGVNRTSLFTKRSGDATATLPQSLALAPGLHTLSATLSDHAGNTSTATSRFTVDLAAPQIAIVAPAAGSYLATTTPAIHVTYQDNLAVDLQSLHILVNGVDRTSLFSKTSTGATWTPSSSTALPQGANQITAKIADTAGNLASASVAFNVDLTKPTVTIVAPTAGSHQGSPNVPVTVTYRDDQALDLSTLQVTVDGHAVAMTAGASSASGTATGLAGGSHTLAASVKDKAGNAASATATFVVDTAAPSLRVVAPAPGAFVKTASPTITIDYSGSVNTATFKASLNGADITSLFTVGAGEATVNLAGKRTLPDGLATISAQIASPAGAVGSTTSSFTVDTTAPAVTITAPTGTVGTGTPAATVTYSDAGSGIDATAVHILLDGADVTSLFAVTAGNAVGTLTPRLADGAHTLSATVADRAGNARTGSVAFQVDTTPPTASFTAPADGSFLNTPAPALVLTYGDGTGAGVDPASVHIFLTPDGGTESEITGLFAVGAQKASGQIPTGSPLADGTYHLRATLADKAGNSATAQASFELDTVKPTYQIVQPAQSSELNTGTPAILITYQDDASGVDTTKLVLKIDGVNKSSLLVATARQATATLGAADALADGPHTIAVTVADRAGNTAPVVPQSFTVDTTGPTIQATPAPSANAAGWNNTAVTVTYACADAGSGVASCPPPVTVASEGAHQVVSASATDAAGNSATASVTLNIDKTSPTITASASPAANSNGWNTSGVTVAFTCADALSGVASCPAPVTVSAAGANQVISGTATDKAGNSATASVTVNLESPGSLPGITASAAPAANAAGWNKTDVTVTYVCAPSLSPIAHCPAPRIVSTEGAGQVISDAVQDQAGNQATASVTLKIDKTPPSLTQLNVPAQLPPGGTATVSVTAADNLALASVAFQVGGSTVATVTAPPYQFDLAVPPGARSGDTLTVTAVATDAAGNSASVSHGVTVASAGVVVGQVLADATGLPLPGVLVQVVGDAQQDITDGNGRYSLAVRGSHLFLRIARPADPGAQLPALLPVEREVSVASGVGTVPVDARLTGQAAPVSIDSTGGTLSAGNVNVTVPAGAVVAVTAFHLTPLSAQGLPALLPLGWSPVVAFDLRADGGTGGISAPLAASFAGLPKNQPLQLVTYNPGLHAWTLVAADLTNADGTLSASLPALGGYALVVADTVTPPLVIPGVGQPLEGLGMVALPADAASAGSLSPPSLSPAGGTSMATLTVQSLAPLPSGTVIQANVTEVYTLTSGDQLSAPSRAEDLVLYGFPAVAGATLAATFPVTPSRSFEVADLQTGKVHLDILAGRENVRGETGGSGAVVVQEGNATLSVAAGSLPEDTAVDLTVLPLAAFLPSGNGLTPLAQYEIDFGGEVLGLPAQLAAGAGSAQPGDKLLLAQIQRFGGVPRLVAVSLAQVTGGQIVTQPYPGLPGITQGGEYVFYKLASPLGFVAGRTLISGGSGGPASALVSTDALPFVTLSDATGRYTITAASGSANLKATVPQTALLGTGSVTVTAGQTVALDLTLAGAVAAATVSPADGALGVDPSAPITITATDALNPSTVTAGNLQLSQVGSSGSTPVAVRFVLAQGNRQISVFPLAALAASTRYTLQVTGLATAVGGLVAVPTVTFTTRSVTPPNFNPDALVFAFPDADGDVAVSAPANSFPPGSKVLIVDQTNGIVLSLTVGNDGSVAGQLPATIDDVLVITITTPDKSVSTFIRSQFVAPDGSVAVGAGGGTVTGPGGVEMRIPEGALDRAVTFKIEVFGPDLFPERPDLPDANFGSGLKITTSSATNFKKEVKLAFPKPADAPDGSFFYVLRRVPNPDGSVSFQTIDHAFVEGTGDQAKVVTASPPFSGILDALQEDWEYLMWTFDHLLIGIASPGLIVGKVMRTVPPGPGQTEPTFEPIGHAKAWRTADTGQKNVSFTNSGGLFSLFDPTRGGGTRPITVQLDSGEQLQATAFELNTAQPDDEFYGISAQLYRQYRNVARLQVIFPPTQPPPPAPDLDIRIFQRDASGNRVDAGGLVPEGTSLVIGVKLNSAAGVDLRSLTVSGQSLTFSQNDSGTPKMDFIATQDYSAPAPGTYSVTATALPVLGGNAISVSRSFRVIAAGGSNDDPDPNQPPGILYELPRTHSLRVPTTVFPQVVFSEPVKNLPGNIVLRSADGQPVTFILSGVGRKNASGVPIVYPNLTDPSVPVTSVTLQPTQGLRFGMKYTLSFGSGIVDLDPQPKPLVAGAIDFTTASPQRLTNTDDVFPSPRVVVLRNYAYVAKNNGTLSSELRAYDVSNPTVLATPVGKIAFSGGQPIDMAGEESAPATNNRDVVAVAPGFPAGIDSEVAATIPARLFFFDVTRPGQMKQIGNVKMTESATQEGLVLRVVLHNGAAYTSTFQKGIQIVRLDDVGSFSGASVQTIPVTQRINGQEIQVTLYGLQAGDYVLDQQSRTLVLATGRAPFVVVDPAGFPAVLFQGSLSDSTGSRLDSGFALALGTVTARNVALVVGQGAGPDPNTGAVTAGPVLAVVDLTDPRNPRPLSFLALPETASDVTVNADALALVALANRTLLVSLGDLAHPAMLGQIDGIAGRVTLARSNVVFSTAYSPPEQGGIHSATLGSACAAFRALLRDSPPRATPIPSTPQLEWSLSGGISDRDGLVLTDVKLGRRKLATKMSLPYLLLKRVDAKGVALSHRCELTPASDSGCTGSSNARVNLLTFQNPTVDQTSYVTEAQYLIDRLDGDPETRSDVPDSCVILTQRYEFDREGLAPLEPFGKFPSARFFPTVRYSYYTDDGGPQLKSLTTAQRFAFDARTPQASDPKAAANATLMSCDPDPLNAYCLPALGNFSVLGLLHDSNPLKHEDYLKIISQGSMNKFTDAEAHFSTIVDNFHSSPQPVGNPDQPIDEAGLTTFGCPACVHIHWRWSSILNANSLKGSFAELLTGADFDPTFNNNDGNPFLPAGSTQDVDIAIETSGNEHPDAPTEVSNLVSMSRSIRPSQLNVGPAFWYVATGHQNADQFFTHGGGFGTFYVNKIALPSTGPLSLQLEHTRAVRYDVKVFLSILVGRTILTTSLPPWSGTLPAGQDDLVSAFNVGLPPETLSVSAVITLDDDALAAIPVPKTEYVKTFTFTQTGTKEP